MTDIMHHPHKTGKQILLEVNLNWLEDCKGILHAQDIDSTLVVTNQISFHDKSKKWSPEHLFIGAISSCYMSNLLLLVSRMGFQLSHFECNAIGQIEMVNGQYEFTRINLYPKIYITDDNLRKKAMEAARKTQEDCLIGHSISTPIIYHTEIFNEKPTNVLMNEI
jgi:organic hydroperoxide reductase OsmC/OhrA